MRIALVFLALAGCAASTAPNGTADQGPPSLPVPQPEAPPPPGPDASAYRAAIEANEAKFHLPGTVTAHLNEEVRIGGVRVKPLAVVQDNRCPVDVTCIVAGTVQLRVALSGAGEQVMELDRPVNLAGGRRLTLVAAAPLNRARPPAGIDPNEPKRFAFRLSGTD